MQGAAELMAVYNTQLTHADGQVTIGVGLALVNQNTAGAVHRLDAVIHIVDDGGVHVVLVVIPVTRVLPHMVQHAEDFFHSSDGNTICEKSVSIGNESLQNISKMLYYF